MRRKSTPLTSVSVASESVEVKNTGLRPSWDVFWGVDLENLEAKEDTATVNTTSTMTSNKSNIIRLIKFVTGSEWIGEWDRLGMCGMGVYKMPHGVIYEGAMNAGVFEGIGVLRYPNGGYLEGFWHGGKLKYCQYDYADGLKRDSTLTWPYSQRPDRRFYSELILGLKPADTEQMTNEEPSREIPPGHYDVGDGFYSLRTKCVTDHVTGEVIRIPTPVEELWTIENCRAAYIGTVGYRPDLYENWFKEDVKHEHQYSLSEKEIITLIMQEGYELDSSASSMRNSRARSSSLPSKLDCLDSLRDLRSASSGWSRSTGDFDAFVKKILKDLEESKFKNHVRMVLDDRKSRCDTLDEEDNEDSDESLLRMLHRIAQSYSGKFDKHLADSDHIGSEPSKRRTPSPEDSVVKLINSSGTPSTLTKPYSLGPSDILGLSIGIPLDSKDSSGRAPSRSMATGSDFLGSKVHYQIDYSEYEGSTNYFESD